MTANDVTTAICAVFWTGVGQTAVGSLVGFLFGLLAFMIQQWFQAKRKAKADRIEAINALNRLTTAAISNIEALANTKLQFADALRPEVEKMQAAVSGFFDLKPSMRPEAIVDMKNLSESLLNFYKTVPRISIMPPPDADEYSLLAKEMPALSMFTHRALGMMAEVNENVALRNATIMDHAREMASPPGMSGDRFVYFCSMLAGHGEAICEHTDFALDFWRLVLDQIEAFMSMKANARQRLPHKLIPKALEAIPKDELFPLMREQLTTFKK